MNNNNLANNIAIALQNIAALKSRVANLDAKINNNNGNYNYDELKRILEQIETNLGSTGNIDKSVGNVIGYDGTNDETTLSYKTTAILEALNTKSLTFKDIFTMTKTIKFDINYIPEVDTERPTDKIPYYIVNEDGICEIGNIHIEGIRLNNDIKSNYIQRLCVLRNICKLYQKYKFVNAEFINADLSYLFADNKYLTSIIFEDIIIFTGSLNFKGFFKNCSSIKMDVFNNLISQLQNNMNYITSLNFDDMFIGCYQFNCWYQNYYQTNITNSSLSLNSLFSNFIALENISMTNMFEPIKSINMISNNNDETTIKTAIDMSNMFNGCKKLYYINLSNMFPNLLSIYSIYEEDSDYYTINTSLMFNQCVALKTVNMTDFMPKLIRITPIITHQILLNNMFTCVLSQNNKDLTFSYSGYVFSNALGNCNDQINKPNDAKEGMALFGIGIQKSDNNNNWIDTKDIYDKLNILTNNIIGFPLFTKINYETKTIDKNNSCVYYNANTQKVITWKYVNVANNTDYLLQTTEIIDN